MNESLEKLNGHLLCLAKISGYMHVNKVSRLTETGVRTWIFDERIIGEIEWAPVMPGRHGDWRQEPAIIMMATA